MKKLLFILIFSPIFAEVKTDDQLWYGIQLKKSKTNFKFEISQENRFADDLKNLHKSLTEFSISYKLNDLLNLSTQYRNIQYDYKFKSRIAISNKIGYSVKKFDFGIKTKFQKDYLNNKTPEELIIRNKFSIDYEFLPFLEPYLSYEIFHQALNANLLLEKYRISSGIKYDLSQRTAIKLYYCYTGAKDEGDFEISNIIGINYEFSF